MALRKLKIMADLKVRNATMLTLASQRADFEKRKADLETALNEAEKEEDINLVNTQIDELEKEIGEADVGKKIETEQAEIDKLNAELETIEEPQSADPKSTENNERGATNMLSKRTIFGALEPEKRSAILASDGVKNFLGAVRAIMRGGQERGIINSSLTIPTVFLDVIRPNLDKYSKLYSKVRVRQVGGESRQTIAGTAPEGVWTEQYATVNELEISFNQISVSGYKIGGYIVVDNALLEDSDENLSSDILEALAQSIGIGLDKAIIYGTGVRMPLGIATRLAQASQPSDWDAKAPTWTDLHIKHVVKLDSTEAATTGADFFATLFGKLAIAKSDYETGDLTWIMNKKTKSTIIQKSIALNSAAAVVSGVTNTMPVIGGEIITLECMADNDILGGYMQLYTVAERKGGTFAQSTDVKFFDDQTVFKGTARYDGKPVFGEAFVLVNINNTNATTSTTFAGDKANTKLVSLSALAIGTTPVTLFPPFSSDVLNYTAKVTAHANKITATALTSGATVSIKNGTTAVTSGSNATFTAGENTLTVEVTNGNATKRTYTVVVDDATA